MRIRHENAIARHETDIVKLKTETVMLKAGLSSLEHELIDIRRGVFAVIADLQASLTRATDKLGEVATALTKSDETVRVLAGKF